MSLTKKARGMLKRLVWQGFPETGHPESEQILLSHEEHLESDALISAALDVVDAADRVFGSEGESLICQALAKFKEATDE